MVRAGSIPRRGAPFSTWLSQRQGPKVYQAALRRVAALDARLMGRSEFYAPLRTPVAVHRPEALQNIVQRCLHGAHTLLDEIPNALEPLLLDHMVAVRDAVWELFPHLQNFNFDPWTGEHPRAIDVSDTRLDPTSVLEIQFRTALGWVKQHKHQEQEQPRTRRVPLAPADWEAVAATAQAEGHRLEFRDDANWSIAQRSHAFQHHVRSLLDDPGDAAWKSLKCFFSRVERSHRKEFVTALFGASHLREVSARAGERMIRLSRYGLHRELGLLGTADGQHFLALGYLDQVLNILRGANFLAHTHPEATHEWNLARAGDAELVLRGGQMTPVPDPYGPIFSSRDLDTIRYEGRLLQGGARVAPALTPYLGMVGHRMMAPQGGSLALYHPQQHKMMIGLALVGGFEDWDAFNTMARSYLNNIVKPDLQQWWGDTDETIMMIPLPFRRLDRKDFSPLVSAFLGERGSVRMRIPAR